MSEIGRNEPGERGSCVLGFGSIATTLCDHEVGMDADKKQELKRASVEYRYESGDQRSQSVSTPSEPGLLPLESLDRTLESSC